MSDAVQEPRRRGMLALVPIGIFAALAVAFFVGLGNEDPSRIPSVLIDKPAPERELPALAGITENGEPVPGMSKTLLASGKVSLVNIWASWCGPCRQEHPLLMDLAGREDLQIIGINYKDRPENARRFLGTLGNPYDAVGVDENGRAAVDWGVYGVPETFIVDQRGVIRFKWIGPLTPAALQDQLLPRIDNLLK